MEDEGMILRFIKDSLEEIVNILVIKHGIEAMEKEIRKNR